MPVDENASRYEYGNGRFDLMTDEEVRTFNSDEVSWLLTCLNELVRRLGAEGHPFTSGGDFEVCHHLHELWVRYPEADFRLEVIKQEETPPDRGSAHG